MKINHAQLSLAKNYSRLLPALILSLGSLVTLSACQKDPETVEAPAEVARQTVPVTTLVTDDQIAKTEVVEDSVANDREVNLAELENNIGAAGAGVTPNAETTTPSPEQAIKGTQITDVQYRSDSGATMSVVFETSATGVLNAIISLSNKPKITLSAPEGQGNNPTYRSKDSTIELISHGGGGTIDLMQSGQLTSFEAVSVEAEVIIQP